MSASACLNWRLVERSAASELSGRSADTKVMTLSKSALVGMLDGGSGTAGGPDMNLGRLYACAMRVVEEDCAVAFGMRDLRVEAR